MFTFDITFIIIGHINFHCQKLFHEKITSIESSTSTKNEVFKNNQCSILC